MKKLGFGLMRLPLENPDDQASIDMEQLYEMVDLFLEQGFTYFDTVSYTHLDVYKRQGLAVHPRKL